VDWIQEIKTNENRALNLIYSQFRDECVSWLKMKYNIISDDAIEIFQTSVVILYDNVIKGKLTQLTSNIKTYLFSIAKNQTMIFVKQSKKKSDKDVFDLLSTYIVEENDHMVLENDIKKADLTLEMMGDPCKSLLQLFFYKGLSMEEITILLGYKNADTTKNQKYKCLKRLQKLYFDYK
jgi:RNA polymerase sigma-70 factor (ECF subfamily)